MSTISNKTSEKHRQSMKDYFTAQSKPGLRECQVCKEKKKEILFIKKKSKYKNTGLCKECKKRKSAEYRSRNPDAFKDYWKKYTAENSEEFIRERQRKSSAIYRFGVKDKGLLVNDESNCEDCGISNIEHKLSIGMSLSIHHKDGQGRKSNRLKQKPNNDRSNLQILCSSCHIRLHNLTRLNRDYSKNSEGLRKSWALRKAAKHAQEQ